MSAISPPPPPRPVPSVDVARESTSSVIRRLEATMLRASSFSDDERHQRVDDEWSTVESLRHLSFVVDVWLSRTIQGQDDPFHPIGLPPHFMPSTLPGSSIDPDARPTFEEACDVLRGRLADLERYVDQLSQHELDRAIGTHAESVAGGLGVIFDELNFHDGFINRDLDKIEASRG
jgi:hypothetical protein